MDSVDQAGESLIYIGVDPGLSGAIAFIDHEDGQIDVLDMPVVKVKRNGKVKRELDYEKLGELHPRLILGRNNCKALVEFVGSMPGQGSSSGFAFGKSTGAIYGVLGTRRIPTETVSPTKWKRHFGLIGKPKDASRMLAIERWPQLEPKLKRKLDNGRSDSLFIAQYGIETTVNDYKRDISVHG